MRKFQLVGCLIALCLAFSATACGGNEESGGGGNGGGTPPPAPPDYKVEKSLDLTDAKSIGLATASALSAGSVRTSAAAPEESPKEPDEVLLVKETEEGLYSIPVSYETDSYNTYATFGAPLLLIGAAGSFMKDVVVEGGIMRVYDNIFTVMSLTGTQRYLIVPNASGKPSVKLLSDTPVDPSNILIQPLN